MTVKEAIEFLRNQPPEALLLVASDGEGNAISECVEIEEASEYIKEGYREWYHADEEDSRSETVCVVWPC